MAKKIKLGDVLQVLTSEGVAYAQVTHKHSEYGFLIRVFSGFYAEQPPEFISVVNSELQFSAFFLVQSAVNQNLISVVANVPVPEHLLIFPVFRSRNGGGGSLWLWDGKNALRLERSLQDKEQQFPTRGIISAPLLVERIEIGYRAETHESW
ncbi:hypothetical protein QN382_23050 [Pseudomonas sp. 10B1]|uniref:hypothetical protein n=1 Tax=unclassified Pseudomonas TaxID=196821 RepID=UPI002B23D208|nr:MULTISPECIES: hypothetical protein [unclassified Pseudomonas]MEA9997412.1 hypothetical protein [Pseudomonas sp. AA4]MEB0089502.1 hypothetical protein [Pseudomonas sp. RTI1]MEB0128584.1 hypothetical protein [Pseudomonas sp. CCC1.2]MEB0155911.1 hypothetical protein [Pseudomonas sp. CCC4.3]MEB0222138.1 hypothetical protein [Pseudomonas sp. AB12(2023)]